jgi:hypothetical protein
MPQSDGLARVLGCGRLPPLLCFARGVYMYCSERFSWRKRARFLFQKTIAEAFAFVIFRPPFDSEEQRRRPAGPITDSRAPPILELVGLPQYGTGIMVLQSKAAFFKKGFDFYASEDI